jgi:bacteriocin-like protein
MINAINPKNNDENNDEKNDVTIVGTDFFTDTESFLNELTDDELQQVRGGNVAASIRVSSWSFFLCNNGRLSDNLNDNLKDTLTPDLNDRPTP